MKENLPDIFYLIPPLLSKSLLKWEFELAGGFFNPGGPVFFARLPISGLCRGSAGFWEKVVNGVSEPGVSPFFRERSIQIVSRTLSGLFLV